MISRYDNTLATQQAAPKVAAGSPIAWTHGPNPFKDWCAQWFGPDSDDDYLAKAVFNLPPMAQVFKEVAPQQKPVGEVLPVEREQAASRLRELAGIPKEDVADPLHPRYIEGYKAGHAAGRKRAAQQPESVSNDTLYLLRRLLSNQHTLTGPEFRAELEKIVGEAYQQGVLEPVGEVQHLHELNDSWLNKLPVGTKLYTAPPAVVLEPVAIVVECGNLYAKVKLSGEAFGTTKVGDRLYKAQQP